MSAMDVETPCPSPIMRHILVIFTFLVALYSRIIIDYEVSFVLAFTTSLLFFIIFLHALDVFPYTLEDDVPLMALLLIYPFAIVYLLFRLSDATRVTSLLFAYLTILLPGLALSRSKNKRINRKLALKDHKKALKIYHGLVDSLDYLKRGHYHLPDSHAYFLESEMQRFRGILQNQERLRIPGVMQRLREEMKAFRKTLERNARAAEPRIFVEFFMNEDLREKEWSVICVKVQNVGEVDGKQIEVILDGTVDFYKRTCGMDYLQRGASQNFRFQVRPHGYGKLLLGVILDVHSAVEGLDPFDWKWRYRYEFELNVSERPDQHIGHLSVQGDFVSGSKINISDSVVLRSRLG